MFSRPTDSGALGEKCEARLEVLVPGEFKDRVARVARMKGHGSTGSYLRRVLEHHLLRDEAEIDAIVRQTEGDTKWRNRP